MANLAVEFRVRVWGSLCVDGVKVPFFTLSVGYAWILHGRGDQWSPAMIYKDTSLLSYFSLTKSTKSQQGGLTPSSLQTSVRRARVSRASHAWRVCAAKGQGESRWFCRSPQLQLYHACEHSARKSRADSCTHCLHARIIGLAGVGEVCALTGQTHIFYFVWRLYLEFIL